MLEEDIAVLSRAAQHGMLGVDGAFAERLDRVPIDHLGKILVVPRLDLLDLVRGTETVEEVDERNSALDGREVRDGAEVHDLLLVGFRHHRKARLTAGVDVGMIAEDVEGVRRDAARRDVDHAGEQFARDLVHIRDHQKKSLRRGVGGGQSARGKRTVHGARGARLRLHLHNLDFFPENVSCGAAENVLIGRAPGVGHFCHGAGRSDRVDGSDLGERVRYVRRGGVAVHGNLFSFDRHFSSSVYFLSI